jgi:hypothetical protein
VISTQSGLAFRNGSSNTKRKCSLFPSNKSFLTCPHHRIFYQHNPDRISTCPVTVHSLLHVADGIEAAGPVWAYWSFVMEQYCGFLKRDGMRSRWKPYTGLDNRVCHVAQLNITKIRYCLVDRLALTGSPKGDGDVFPERSYWLFVIPPTIVTSLGRSSTDTHAAKADP